MPGAALGAAPATPPAGAHQSSRQILRRQRAAGTLPPVSDDTKSLQNAASAEQVRNQSQEHAGPAGRRRSSSRPRSPPPARLPCPGSRSRPARPPTRPRPGTRRSSRSSSARKRTRVTATALALAVRRRVAAMPLITSWSRPDSARRNASASPRVRAACRTPRPSSTTAVSTPSTRSPPTARALRSAFSTHHLTRIALTQLLDVRRLDPELDSELLQDRPPPG